jgi:ApaG protein
MLYQLNDGLEYFSMSHYQQETDGIVITARPFFMPDQAVAVEAAYVWTYEITVANKTDKMVQLLNRHWLITDANGVVDEIKGPGVVGLQPLIGPGEQFSYSSFCVLKTPSGKMRGTYEMQTLDRAKFLVQIPEFMLLANEIPGSRHIH